MLGILLMILKIIGIILLIVLAIVIAVLGILLFVPVRYRFYGCFRENCRVAEGKITWLMHIVSCPFFNRRKSRHTIPDIWKKSRSGKEKTGKKKTEKAEEPDRIQNRKNFCTGSKRTVKKYHQQSAQRNTSDTGNQRTAAEYRRAAGKNRKTSGKKHI